jgi:hypothetical protein
VQVLIRPNKRFLYDIFGIVSSRCHLVRKAVNQSAVPVEQAFKGVKIPISGSLDERSVAV